ncbi:MAG: CbiX/SirB N-terminal domain-containing protein [Oleibacter sp.]|nr:CbiX/SirB N-terminal domain-containing protein [Thalassolituus sp.]
MTKATILLAHGSSDANWLAPFETLTAQIQAGLNGENLMLGYMELAEPTLETCVRRLATEGVKDIDVLPLFFAAGRHLRKDVPQMIDELIQELSTNGHTINIRLSAPVGLEPEVANAIASIVTRKVKHHDSQQ